MAPNKWTLEAVNQRLKAGKIGVSVRQRGNRLSLRATLPPKPGSGKQVWYQQDITLGIYGNPAGLARAETEAKLLGVRIASGEFDWGQYIELPDLEEEKFDSQFWISRFEADYYVRRGRTPKTEATWKSDYRPALQLLSGELTNETLINALTFVPANTRKRKLVCEKLAALAKMAGVAVDRQI